MIHDFTQYLYICVETYHIRGGAETVVCFNFWGFGLSNMTRNEPLIKKPLILTLFSGFGFYFTRCLPIFWGTGCSCIQQHNPTC
jgi:hypothetical protein